jgi:hypothetical protein
VRNDVEKFGLYPVGFKQNFKTFGKGKRNDQQKSGQKKDKKSDDPGIFDVTSAKKISKKAGKNDYSAKDKKKKGRRLPKREAVLFCFRENAKRRNVFLGIHYSIIQFDKEKVNC